MFKFIKKGFYKRKCDRRFIQRFQCQCCKITFSKQTFSDTFRQHKPFINNSLEMLFASGVTIRRSAKILKIRKKTAEKRFKWLASIARRKNPKFIKKLSIENKIQVDEMESFEHTKLKPLTIALSVCKKTRVILSFKVSEIPAKGKLAHISVIKYGKRANKSDSGFTEMLKEASHYVKDSPHLEISSDKKTTYNKLIKDVFPNALHKTTKGVRGCVTGQGEMKKTVFDPLFSFNHTAAMLRENVSRLKRKTWTTTKIPLNLEDHIAIYTYFHNRVLLQKSLNKAYLFSL